MSNLSERVKTENAIDEHWDINCQVTGANCVCVRPSHDNSHINLYTYSDKGNSKVEIPHAKVNISDTKYGVVVFSE